MSESSRDEKYCAKSWAAIDMEGVVDVAEGKWTCDDGIESMESNVTIGVENV